MATIIKCLSSIFPYEIAGKITLLLFYLILILLAIILSRELKDHEFILALLFISNIVIFQIIFRFDSRPLSFIFSILYIIFYFKALKKSYWIWILGFTILLSLYSFLEFAFYSIFFFYIFVFLHTLYLKKINIKIMISLIIVLLFLFIFYLLNKNTFTSMNIQSDEFKRFYEIYRIRFFHQLINFQNIFFKHWNGTTLIKSYQSLGIVSILIFFYGVYKKIIPYYFSIPALIGINIAFRNTPPLLTLFPFFKGMGVISFILAFIGSFFILFFIVKYFIKATWIERIIAFILLVIPFFGLLSVFKVFRHIRAPIHFFQTAGVIYYIIGQFYVLKTLKKKIVLLLFLLIFFENMPLINATLRSDELYGDIAPICHYLKEKATKNDRFFYLAFQYNLFPEVIMAKTGLSTSYGGWYSWLQNRHSLNVNGYLFNNIDPKFGGIRFYILKRDDPNFQNFLHVPYIKNVKYTNYFAIIDFGEQKLFETERKLLPEEKIRLEYGINKLIIHYNLQKNCNIEVKFVRQALFEKKTTIFNNIYPHNDFIQLTLPMGEGAISFF